MSGTVQQLPSWFILQLNQHLVDLFDESTKLLVSEPSPNLLKDNGSWTLLFWELFQGGQRSLDEFASSCLGALTEALCAKVLARTGEDPNS